MRIRRVHGQRGPSDVQPQDGIWRRMSGIEGPVVGEAMVVYWAKEAAGNHQTDYGFRTTGVVEVNDETIPDDGVSDGRSVTSTGE
jgi:hypothetical protein